MCSKAWNDVFIPDGETVLREGDKIHMAATHKELEVFLMPLEREAEK